MEELKKEILEEFDKKFYRLREESIVEKDRIITKTSEKTKEDVKTFISHTIDRVREEEVEEIPIMKGTLEALDNITIRKEEEFSLNKVKENPYHSWLKKIADKKIEILINKNIEDELELELDDLIELVEEMEQEKLKDEYRKGYNQRLKDEGKTGEDYQGLYL